MLRYFFRFLPFLCGENDPSQISTLRDVSDQLGQTLEAYSTLQKNHKSLYIILILFHYNFIIAVLITLF